MKLNFHHKLFNYLTTNGWLDYWTAVHIAAGAFICKVALWLGTSNKEALLWVLGIALLWEVLEWYAEAWKPYGTKRKWRNNTISDVIVAVGIAYWMILPV